MKNISKIIQVVLMLPVFLTLAVLSGFGQDVQQKAKEYYQKGNYYYDQGMYTEAQEEFKKALDLLNHREEISATEVIQPAKTKELEPSVQPATAVSSAPVSKSPTESAGIMEYMIGNEDVLMISVWQNPDLDQEAIVRPDGKISIPLIGDVQASGYTIPGLDEVITQKLKHTCCMAVITMNITTISR